MATCGGLLDDLASLFHRAAVVRGSLPDREPPLPRLLQGVAVMLRNLAREAPVIAVLDDVHFADASSWEALRYFARHLDDSRLLAEAARGDIRSASVPTNSSARSSPRARRPLRQIRDLHLRLLVTRR